MIRFVSRKTKVTESTVLLRIYTAWGSGWMGMSENISPKMGAVSLNMGKDLS